MTRTEVWKPKENQFYFAVSGTGIVAECLWDNARGDNLLYDAGNCFTSREQAEEAAKRVRATLLDFHAELAQEAA